MLYSLLWESFHNISIFAKYVSIIPYCPLFETELYGYFA